MARKNPQPKETKPMKTIQVQGVALPVEDRYAEGYTLNANEAQALNQTLFENLRNNFAPKLKEAKEVQGDAFSVDATYTTGEGDAAVTHPSISEQWAAHSASYAFGARRVGGGGKRTTDPVQREANRIARASVEKAIREKYGKLDAVPRERIQELVDQLAVREDIVAKARENVENMGSLDLGVEV